MSDEHSHELPKQRPQFLSPTLNRIFSLAVSILILLYCFVLVMTPSKLFADDSYFYLQIAWNFARGMGSTFNAIMPTNGYHPVWMLICSGIFKLFPDKFKAIHVIASLIGLLQILTLWTVRKTLKRVAGDVWIIAFVLLIPFCFTSQLGTEGALSGLSLSLVMLFGYCLVTSHELSMAWAFNLIAALAVLIRLDNIFIIGFVWIAVWLAFGHTNLKARYRTGIRSGRNIQLMLMPVYIVLWGTYLASNYIFFGILQPISGMLKSNSKVDHVFGMNLPHTAQLSLAIIFICLPILACKKKDVFFYTIEIPFTLGVISHALYIALRMSNETRWSWYYTSWILLSSVLLARVGSIVLESRRWLVIPVGAISILILSATWVGVSYRKIYLAPDYRPTTSFNEAVYKRAGIHRAFAYDQPGILAYYSDVQIVPLDGLMGNVQFQRDLASKGIQRLAEEEKIDGFIGPPVPFKRPEYDLLCQKVFISSEKFHCQPERNGTWSVTGVDVFARVPAAPAGAFPLRDEEIVQQPIDWITIWKFAPDTKRALSEAN